MTREHLAVHTDRDPMYWSLIVPSTAETCEQQAEEMAELGVDLLGTFEDFVTPTEVEFYVHCFPAGYELPASVNDGEKIETIHRVLESRDGVTVDALREALDVDGAGAEWIPRVAIEGTRVTVDLGDGPVQADRNHNTVAYRGKRPTGQQPDRDPIEITVLHGPNSWEPDIETEYVTSVMVRPWSDIWFGDSDVSRANRPRLAAFLERVEDALPVAVVDRTSDWLPVEELEAVY